MITLKEINYTISLIKSGISGGKTEVPPENLDWNALYLLAFHQHIVSLINFSISKLPQDIKQNIPISAQLTAACKQSLYFDVNRQAEAGKLSKLFSDNQVDFVFLKGYVTKNLYPDTSLRFMSDTDILYRSNTSTNMESLMKTAGYELKKHTPKDDAYLNPTCGIYVELHRHLVDKGYETEYNFLDNIWEKLIKKDEHEYVMTDEDFYIYHIIHMSKHVRHSGLGLLHFIDLLLYICEHQNMNIKYIESCLEELRLTSFEKYSRMLACKMFSTDSYENISLILDSKKYSEDDEKILDSYFSYLLNSGSLGNTLQKEVNSIVSCQSTTSPKSGFALIRRIFPNKTTMINYYGNKIEKHPWLIPFYWIYLNLSRLFSKDRSLIKKKQLLDNISENHIETTKYLMDNLFK